jgi:hypothetical protein
MSSGGNGGVVGRAGPTLDTNEVDGGTIFVSKERLGSVTTSGTAAEERAV